MSIAKIFHLIVWIIIFIVQNLSGQVKTIVPDLSKIVTGEGWRVVNRDAEILDVNGQRCVRFTTSNQQGGVAWLEDMEFDNGTIEVDIKGKNVRGGSFLGIAFRGENDSTYDAVYFRPFNFPGEANARGRSVQYISHPEHPWYQLRQDHPGRYENSVNPVPDPDQFFHVRIVVEKPSIKVYMENSDEPSLVVDELTERNSGKIGLWMDYVSDGAFANLKITPDGSR